MTKINIGIADNDRQKTAEGLERLLADTYSLYLKTQNFHWNVEGPMFSTLHALFESQYDELADAVDEIAERIRTLGFPAPGSFSAFATLTSLKEVSGVPSAMDMVQQLLSDHEAVMATVGELLKDVNDAVSEGFLADRLGYHQKTAWILRSSLN